MYALLGHSRINNTNVKKVPKGVTLVLLAKCGRQFNANNKFHAIFKNNKKINKFLEFNTNKEVYPSGSNYTNQVVRLESLNTMPHGLVTLPINIRAISNHNSIARGNVKISNALSIINRKGGGIMFGVFCRGTPNVYKVASGRKIISKRLVVTKGQKGPFGSYNNVLKKRKEIKNRVVRATHRVYKRPITKPNVLNYGNF